LCCSASDILSQLEESEKLIYPWHRVVTGDASLGAPKKNPDGTSQAELLRDEGILVSANRIDSSFDRVFVPAEQLKSGLARQKRAADAPVAKQSGSPPVRKR
jgi:methylated-DNA-protein-cysteine methyltransferase related protein